MEPPVVAAAVAAGASVILGIWNFVSTRASNRDLEAWKQRGARELAQLAAQLQQTNTANDARLSYEFHARRRLYEELEPLTFQLVNAVDSAYARVTDLARAARDGNLDGPDNWLAARADDYFLLSTAYRLTVPLATLRIWHRRLTLVDLTLDPLIEYRYVLGRRLALTFSEDFFLADAAPPLAYRPSRAPSDRTGETGQERQGIYVGLVEAAADAMLVRDEGNLRVVTFAEFQEGIGDGDSELRHRMSPILILLTNFHPVRRPVTWRILIAQAHLHRALITAKRAAGSEAPERSLAIPEDERSLFEWRDAARREVVEDAEVLTVPFDAAVNHLSPEIRRNLALLRGI